MFVDDTAHLPALQRSLPDVVAEYDVKRAGLAAAVAAYEQAGRDLDTSASVGGSFGGSIAKPTFLVRDLSEILCRSAWRHIYEGLKIGTIASADDKRKFEQAMQNPPEFTLDTIAATFGDYVRDPRGNILRGLAEAFCELDPAYKSHDRVKIGVKGLPKRVILSGFGQFQYHGVDRLRDVLNALAAYQGKPLLTYRELDAITKEECALLKDGELPAGRYDAAVKIIGRGVRLRRYENGNGHLLFEPETLLDINRALAEFYGDVLPDAAGDQTEKRASTAVAKDLQFYGTPAKLAMEVVAELYPIKGQRVLEPSCGEAALMIPLRDAGADVFGFEYDAGRVAISRAKGFKVVCANFLEVAPRAEFDRVVMNPPFYGRHYALHVKHALKFLKPGGRLTAILPATARYDHGLLHGHWQDLPIGSFRASGTNINTTVLTMAKE